MQVSTTNIAQYIKPESPTGATFFLLLFKLSLSMVNVEQGILPSNRNFPHF